MKRADSGALFTKPEFIPRATFVAALSTWLLLSPESSRGQGQTIPIPIRSVAILAATDSGLMQNITDVRELTDGRLLVNDRNRRRVVLIDRALSTAVTLIGDDPGALSRYGYPTRLLAGIADSSVFVDYEARALILIDPGARIVRAIAPPRTYRIFLAWGIHLSAMERSTRPGGSYIKVQLSTHQGWTQARSLSTDRRLRSSRAQPAGRSYEQTSNCGPWTLWPGCTSLSKRILGWGT
jgi:hypothetical protein